MRKDLADAREVAGKAAKPLAYARGSESAMRPYTLTSRDHKGAVNSGAAIVVSLAMAMAGCGSKEGARLDPALRTIVPKETTMLAAIQVEELVKSPLYQKHLSNRDLPQLDAFEEEIGVDVRKDLWEVMLLSDGTHSASVARGKFSEGEAEPRINRQGTRFGYKGYTFIGDEETAVMFLSPTVAGIGSTPLLRRVVDARGESNGPPPALAERMKKVPYESEVWAVFNGSPFGGRLPVPGSPSAGSPPAGSPPAGSPPAGSKDGKGFAAGKNTTVLAQAANSIQGGTMYLDVTTLVDGTVTLESDADANAKQLHESLRGLLGLAQLMSPEYQKLLSGVQVTQQAKEVNLHMQTSEDTLVPLLDLVQ